VSAEFLGLERRHSESEDGGWKDIRVPLSRVKCGGSGSRAAILGLAACSGQHLKHTGACNALESAAIIDKLVDANLARAEDKTEIPPLNDEQLSPDLSGNRGAHPNTKKRPLICRTRAGTSARN